MAGLFDLIKGVRGSNHWEYIMTLAYVCSDVNGIMRYSVIDLRLACKLRVKGRIVLAGIAFRSLPVYRLQ